jgi:hypothetical protein
VNVLADSKFLFLPFFLIKKGNQKIKHGIIAPRIRAGHRLPNAEGAALWFYVLFG